MSLSSLFGCGLNEFPYPSSFPFCLLLFFFPSGNSFSSLLSYIYSAAMRCDGKEWEEMGWDGKTITLNGERADILNITHIHVIVFDASGRLVSLGFNCWCPSCECWVGFSVAVWWVIE